MSTLPVHWHEGLFLRPHHFQLFDRRVRESVRQAEEWLLGYAYGIRSVDIDEQRLKNWNFAVNSLEIRLQDGTHVRFPEEASLAPLTIPREAFKSEEQRIRVAIAVPRLRMGHQNSAFGKPDPDARYTVESVDVDDENEAGNRQSLDVRWINARLMIVNEEAEGYELLPIAQLRLGAVAEAPPEIDPDYIPPLLACNAWSRLQNLISGIVDQLGGLADRLSRQMIDRGVAFESGHREDLERILKLQAVNCSLGQVQHLSSVRGVHPLDAYVGLCAVLGQLSIFRAERRMPTTVPAYNHDDLAVCFYALRTLLDLGDQPQRAYVKRPFIGAGLQMQVRIDREWLTPDWAYYIGVQSKLKFHEIERLLMQRLDMKVGSSEEVDTIYKFARRGAGLQAIPDPPRDFPLNEWTYWKVDRSTEAWKAVERTLNLGIRFNERQVQGKVDGEQQIQIQNPESGQLVSLSFALYAMPTKN